MRKISFVLCLVVLALSISFVGCNTNTAKRTEYEIEVSLSNDFVLTGKEVVTFYNDTDNAFDHLKFNLFGNAFRKGAIYSPIAVQYQVSAYPNGLSYGDMQVQKVTDGKDDLQFQICGEDANILKVDLPTTVYPQESVVVVIDFTLKLANVVARTGYNDNTINLGNFYPILCGIDDNGFYECLYYPIGDPFFSDVANYTVSISADESYVIASSGKVIESKTSDGKISATYELNNARSFAMVLSTKFESVTESCLGTEITYYFYKDQNPKESLEFAKKSMTLFTDKFGEYPYPTYSVVQTEFVQGGMEFPGLVMISDQLDQKSFCEVIVHETAHQWWQTVVGNNEIEYGFLDEGLAEYSVVLFYENYPEYSMTRANMIQSAQTTYKVFCSVYDKLFGSVNTVMLRPLKDFGSEYEYVNLAYIKPCIMYEYLRQTVGEKTFFTGLKKYYKEYSFKNAKPCDLIGVFEKIGGDTNGFFDSFLSGKVII